jgi:hypothetical protein
MATAEHNFVSYLFQHVYVVPADRDRPFRSNILGRRLGVAADRITYLDSGACPRPVQDAGNDREPRDRESKGFLAALDSARARGERSILLLRDDTILHKRFDEMLEARLGAAAGRDWRGVRFTAGAYAFRHEVLAAAREALARHDRPSDGALARFCTAAAELDLAGAAVGPAELAGADLRQYLYNHSRRNRRISVCCATRRPEFLDNVLRSFARQSYPDRELILILQGWSRPADLERRARALGIRRLTVLERDASVTLGECLNAGVEASRGYYWCKIDDDDFYDVDYLQEAFEHMVSFPCDLVGKTMFHVFFPAEHRGCRTTEREYAGLPFPRHSGGTIFARRRVVEALAFPAWNLCEDQELYRAAAERGLALVSTGTDNYVYVRHGGNTSEFERHLSIPWQLDASPLYVSFAREYGPWLEPDLAALDLPDFTRYFHHAYKPRRPQPEIPRIIHQIWIGPHPRPTEWLETWSRDYLEDHPDWSYRLWTDDDVAGFPVIRSNAYRNLSLCGRADLLRYSILHEHGGVYIDADSIYLNPFSLDDALRQADDCGIVLAQEPFRRGEPPLIAVGFIACAAGNPLLRYFIHRGVAAVDAVLAQGGHLQAWETTGPAMVTPIVEAVRCRAILPAHRFFPEYWNNKQHWQTPREDLARLYPNSLMFQFGFSTNQIVAEGHT